MHDASRPILLTGVNGQLGGSLFPLLCNLGPVVAPTRAELDLANAGAVREFVRELRPRLIVNPAAYTAVDKAESEPRAAFAVNAEAVEALGLEAVRLDVPVWHFSTDYVFNGEGEQAWREEDATAPLGVYGASKLAGEKALAASGAAHLIFRTSWVYGAHGKNFLLTILRAAREREELRIVADQHGAPTWSNSLAQMTVSTLQWCALRAEEHGTSLTEAVRAVQGVYHASDAGTTTWFGFAKYFLELARSAEPQQKWARLTPIPTAEYPTPAKRPENSRLNGEKLSRTFGLQMPTWQESTAKVMQELAEAKVQG